jgi:hypothetical protein
MYPPTLVGALGEHGVDAMTVAELAFAGRPDPDVLELAVAEDRVLLTENVADFAALAADWLLAGRRHPGILIALSSRFSRRPGGRAAIAAAIAAVADEELADRVIFLEAQR